MNVELLGSILWAAVIGLGCSAANEPAPADDTDSAGMGVIAEDSPEAWGLIHFLNAPGNATYASLHTMVGVTAKPATNIAKHVLGAEWQGGKIPLDQAAADPTADDDPIDTIAELDAISYVGPKTLAKLVTYVQSIGGVPAHLVEGVPLSKAEADAILDLVNHASQAELDDKVPLDARAAAHIVSERPIASVEALGHVAYVGKLAIERLRDYTAESTAPDFAADGPSTPADFWQLSVESLPMSEAVKAAASAAEEGNYLARPGRYLVDPTELEAVLADPTRLEHFAFDLLFEPGNVDWADHWTAKGTPIAADAALDTFLGAMFDGWSPEEIGDRPKALQPLVRSLFKGDGFDPASVLVLQLHWDNADDTRFEGLAVMNTTTGEVRVLSFDFPA